MELVYPNQIAEDSVRTSFRYAAWPHLLVGSALGLPVVLAAALLAPHSLDWSWAVWGAVVPCSVLIGGLLLLASRSSFLAARATFLPTNWVMKVGPNGVWLQIRSYLNHHFHGRRPTILFLPYEEISSASKVSEWFDRYQGGERTRVRRTFLEFEAPGLEAMGLRSLIAAERARRGPGRTLFGITSRLRYDHVPVLVAGPTTLRIDWRGEGMLDAVRDALPTGVIARQQSTTALPIERAA